MDWMAERPGAAHRPMRLRLRLDGLNPQHAFVTAFTESGMNWAHAGTLILEPRWHTEGPLAGLEQGQTIDLEVRIPPTEHG